MLRLFSKRVAASIAFCCVVNATFVYAADETFVGILALAVDEEVAVQLGLDPSTRRELEELVDDRESEALEMALTMRDLPEEQQEVKLTAFRAESELRGLKLLSATEQKSLNAIRLGRTGMPALVDAGVAKQLGLSSDQKKEIADLMAARNAALDKVGSSKSAMVGENFDRQLKAVLSQEQIATWTKISTPTGGMKPANIAKRLAKKPQPQRADGDLESAPEAGVKSGDGKLRFSFKYELWGDVIEWFAEECDLSLLMDTPPQGSLNYTDPREYTPAQAIDLLNSVLLTKGYTLVRREKMLYVVNLEDGIPPNLVTEVLEDDLDELGEYELVRCLFTLQSVNAEDAREEISRLLGPQGSVNVIMSSNQLSITETAGRLRSFRSILQQGERQNASALGKARLVPLQHVRAVQIIAAWRKLMGLTDEDNATLDGSLRVSQGKSSRELLVSGKPNSLSEFEALVKLLDVPNGAGPLDTPQLEVYPLASADPESVLQVMETLLEGVDEVRLATDDKTGSLVALARPAEHEVIRSTMRQLTSDPRKVEVIRLRAIDPQLAMLSIEKLFGPPSGSEEEGSGASKAPIVDADPVTRSLMIRGSESQIEDIRTLLSKMGESDDLEARNGLTGRGGNLRVIPIDAATARRAMKQLNTIWPTVRKNQIRTVSPASSIRGIRMGVPKERIENERESGAGFEAESDMAEEADVTSRPVAAATRFVSNELDEDSESNVEETPELEVEPLNEEDAEENLPEVIVTIGEQGLLIASEDTQALDEFEELFRTLSDRLFAGSRELTIFYLRYAKAEVAGEFVKQFVGGASSGSGGGTLLGNIAGAALGGGSGGGIIGSLLGVGGGSSTSVSLSKGTSVIADPRLNALVVQATPKELDFIEQLLKAIDKASSPQIIETVPRPRAIPVFNTNAEDVAEVVRSIYATRMNGGRGSSGRQRQPSPEDFLKAMTGQKNTGKQISEAIGEQVGITISVDSRRNALIVIAPESLFNEIRDLVEELDFAKPGLEETVRYGSVSGASPEIVRSALESLMEESAVEAARDIPQKSNMQKPKSATQESQRSAEEMKRGFEFMKAMQKMNDNRAKKAAAQKKAAGKSK